MMKTFCYEQTTKIIFGSGSLNQVGNIVSEYGKTVLLVTVPEFPAIAPLYQRIKSLLADSGITVYHYDGVVPNPTTESINAGVAMAREKNVDVVIGLGGGSSMDSAKAIAMTAVNPGEAWDYLFFKTPQPQKTLPCIAISTTSGTGSQVTQVAVMTQTATSTKSAISNNLIYPRVAIVDPELMTTLPSHITASTGFDAFCHCFESYINVNAFPYTDIIALEGIRYAVKYLKRAVEDGNDLEAREGMAWADTCGGLAIANAGVTLPHGVGMMISGHCPKIMHGEALALTYPSFTRCTYPHSIKKFAEVGRIFRPELIDQPDEVAAEQCCEAIDEWLKSIGMWLNFKQFSVEPDMLKKIADRGHELPDYKGNPVIVSTEEIYQQLLQAYDRTTD